MSLPTSRFHLFREGGLLGLVIGGIHGAVEAGFLGWYGIRLHFADAVILLLSYPAGGLVIGVALGGLFALLPQRLGQHPRGLRLAFLAGLFSVTVTLGTPPGGTAGWVISLILASCALIGAVQFVRTTHRFATFFSLLALQTSLVAYTFWRQEWAAIPGDHRFRFGLALLMVPPIFCVFSLPWPRQLHRRSHHPVGATLIPMALVFTFWGTGFPNPLRWHVLEDESLKQELSCRNPKDVILIVLDTVRADHLDLFGYERKTMPRLAEFAAECDVVEQAMATAPSSLPSHASMFTGMYPSTHGGHKPYLHDRNPPPYAYFVRDDLTTLSEALSFLGFQTAGISANFGVLSSYGLGRGFQFYDVAGGAPFLGKKLSWMHAVRLFKKRPAMILEKLLPDSMTRRTQLFTDREPPYRRAEEINERAIAWLDEHGAEPFFLFLNYFDAHDPYLPAPEYNEMFGEEPRDLDWVGFPKTGYHRILSGEVTPTATELDFMKAQYDAELRYLDDHLARLFQFLKDRGLYEDTLLFVVSDHGEGFFEHGFLRHSTTLYESQISIPFLVKLPAGSDARLPDDTSWIQFVDIFPSVMSVLGSATPEELEGKVWGEGRGFQRAEVFCHHPGIERLQRELFGYQRNDLKFITSTRGHEEVYDLKEDPGEQNNLQGEFVEFEAAAREIYEQRKQQILKQVLNAGNQDPALLESLRALGYIHDEQ